MPRTAREAAALSYCAWRPNGGRKKSLTGRPGRQRLKENGWQRKRKMAAHWAGCFGPSGGGKTRPQAGLKGGRKAQGGRLFI